MRISLFMPGPMFSPSRRVHPLFILLVLSTLTPGTRSYSNTPQPPVAPPGTFDWLTAVPADFAAVSLNTWEVPRVNNSALAGIELTNGLITRRFTTFPDFATWDYLSHLEDEETSLLRYIGPEGEATPLSDTLVEHIFSHLGSPLLAHSPSLRALSLPISPSPVSLCLSDSLPCIHSAPALAPSFRLYRPRRRALRRGRPQRLRRVLRRLPLHTRLPQPIGHNNERAQKRLQLCLQL